MVNYLEGVLILKFIFQVVGVDREVCYLDKLNLFYVEVIFLEVFRIVNIGK